ncbi:hypothetical protein PPERSA_12995 [Pseudocohnilembus persalinus]|uniref:Sperm-tail PG-rich repeat n=1 Tax=Pseudocohnilembus persalinus TaxID=266149 RepID=A0A0V0R1W1_PSEPJ|nr:hypothetical protein PPERSA_12995 [Pseudocohnilembus persalinus]|eukprot:KRX08514.1 hypothetical protein PPERSA_12995 [Pseudocohnilembus persalinus]
MSTSLPASMRPKSVPNLKFDISEMYKIATRESDAWGIEGYQVPKKYQDHYTAKWEKKIQEQIKQKKKPGEKAVKATKRGNFLDDEIKLHNPCYPKPNTIKVQYDQSDNWKMDQKTMELYKQKFKVDQKLNKKTYIDQIIHRQKGNSKVPGPGQYSVTKTQEAIEKEIADMKKKVVNKGGDLPNYLHDVQYVSSQIPGPNSYHPKLPSKDTFEWSVDKKQLVAGAYYKIPPKEWISKHTVKIDKKKEKPEPFHPYPVSYNTFGKQLLKSEGKNKNQSSNVKHWGTTKRFADKAQTEKLIKKQTPGAYSLLAKWPDAKPQKGQKSMTTKSKSTKFFNFNQISKGTEATRSIYY